jgi:hypothetical protein
MKSKSNSKSSIQPRTTQFQRSALASACALALGGLVSTSANAQLAQAQVSLPTSVVFTKTYADLYIPNKQFAKSNETATITNVINGASYLTAPVGGPGTPVSVTSNSTTALTIGNIVDPNLIDIVLIAPSGGSAGILSSQVRANDAGTAVSSTAQQTNVTMGSQEAAQVGSSVNVSSNSISSITTLNQARSVISGDVPIGYTSATTGSVSATFDAAALNQLDTTAKGSLGINSNQISYNAGALAGSQATVTGSTVLIDSQGTTGGLTLPQTLSGNSISTAYTGNAVTNSINPTGTLSPFIGSIALNNSQANIEDLNAAPVVTSQITTSQIIADVTDRTGGSTVLTAPLTVADNSVTATSAGNTAGSRSSTGIVAGNSIILTDASVSGVSSPTSNSLVNGNNLLTANVTSDLVLASGQGNQGTSLTSEVTGSNATLRGGVISIRADDLGAGGSVTASGNTVSAGSTGNLAGNLISTSGTGFTSSAAASNSQSNDATTISGTVTNGTIAVNVGNVAAISGNITSSGNTVAASADGNVAGTTVNVDASNLTASATGTSGATANTNGFGATSATGGISATNLQANYGAATTIGSTVTNSFVTVNVADQAAGGTPLVPVSAANITLSGNTISSDASGNSAGTDVAMSGTIVSGQAALGNDQFNGNIISGQNLNSGATINTGAVSTGSNLVLSGNTVSSSGTGNNAVNQVDVNQVPGDGAKLTAGTSAISATPSASVTGGVATSTAAFSLASGQRNEASVSSLTQNLLPAGSGGSFATVYAGTAIGGIADSDIAVSGNNVTSDTTGNRVGNTISLTSTNLDTTADAASNIASVANLQVNAVTGVANATVQSSAPSVTAVGIAYSGSPTGTAGTPENFTVSTNTVSASSLGNVSGNTINATGTSLTSLAPAANISGVADTSTGSVTNEFAVANVQSDAVSGGRAALVDKITLGISNATQNAAVSEVNMTVSDNNMLAEARNNDASSTVALTGFSTLSSGISVLNQQSSSTNVSAGVTEGRLRIRVQGATATADDSSFALSDNTIKALAVGSSASNSVTASAGTLSGNSNNATSGVVSSPTIPLVTADYGVANAQSQTGTVSATTSTPMRIVLGDLAGAGGTIVTDSNLTLSGNNTSAIAQATSASNSLTLAAVGDMTNITGAIGSGQSSTGAVTALVRPESVGAAVFDIDARSFSNSPVAVTNNHMLASAGQNEAFNSASVTGANITGGGVGGLTGMDFTVSNNQSGTGDVGATVIPGILGVAANSFTTGSVAVTGNTETATAIVNNGNSGLLISATGDVNANGYVGNTQSAVTGAVSSAVGSTVDVANDSIGVVAATGAANVPSYTNTSVTVSDNITKSQATRNTTVNGLTVKGSNINGGLGTTPNYTVDSAQTAAGNVTATTDLNVIGANVGDASGTSFSVTGNKATSAANDNIAGNSMLIDAVSEVAASGLVNNVQTGGIAANTTSATMNVTTVGLATDTAGNTDFTGGSVAVDSNLLKAQAGRNTATNSLTATGATITGGSPTGLWSFTAQNSQTAAGAVTAAATVGTIGATASTTTGGTSFSVSDNRVDALANANTASTDVLLDATSTLSGTARAQNSQTSTVGAISATVTTTAVGVQGGVTTATMVGSPVTVSGNVLNADASRNVTSNSVIASAVGITGGAAVGALATSPASFNVDSAQTAAGDITATNNIGLIGVTTNSATGGTTFGIVDNSVFASANANIAVNKMQLKAVNSLAGNGTDPIGSVSNTQDSQAGAISATVGGTSNAVRATVGVAPSPTTAVLNAAPTSVSGNVLAAQGGGNTATNTLEASAINSIGGSTFPTFGVLNGQTNAATVTTAVQYANIGLTSGTLGSVTNSAVTVQGNQVSATGYGNSAYNSIQMTALIGSQNQASAMVSNTQTNTAAISSTVQGVTIGATGGSTSGGATVVSNNSTNATSIGNSAANYITSK